MIRPLRDYILIEQYKMPAQTARGLYLPDKSQHKEHKGKVIAVGSGLPNSAGIVPQQLVKAGNYILFNQYAGAEVKDNGTEYLLIREADITAIITE